MQILDSIVNFFTALGTAKDPNTHTKYIFNRMTRQQLEFAYASDWIAKKIVNAPAMDATSKWRRWQTDQDKITAIETLEKKIDLQRKTKKALIRGRLYGGGALVIGVDNTGTPDEPLDLNRVKAGSLRYVHVMSKVDLVAAARIYDVDSPWFGEPEYYTVATAQNLTDSGGGNISQAQKIHPSRVVKFLGDEITDTMTAPDMWGAESVLQAVNDVVRDVATVNTGIAGLLADMKVDVLKIKGLSARISDPVYRKDLITRVSTASAMKSQYRMLTIDSEEDWSRNQTNFTSLPDVMREYMNIVAGASDIPISRILGQSARGTGGLGGGASGESDTRNYYDRIKTEQETIISPAMNPLDEVIIRSATGSDGAGAYYEWPPLWQMDDTQKSTNAKTKADATKVYFDIGAINPDALRDASVNQLQEDPTLFPGLEDAIEEHGLEPEEPQQPTVDPAVAAAMAAMGKPVPGQKPGAPPVAPKKPPVAANDAMPRTLYVRRDVLNAEEIKKWAADQGFPTTVPADEMHVTIVYSRTPLDWMKTGSDWCGPLDGKGNADMVIPEGGARLLEKMGNAIALLFVSSPLFWRNESLQRAGAVTDYPDYQPHISLTFDPFQFDWRKAEPYRGKIVLGPEIFEEVKDDESWRDTFTEDAAYEASRGDVIPAKPKRTRSRKTK